MKYVNFIKEYILFIAYEDKQQRRFYVDYDGVLQKIFKKLYVVKKAVRHFGDSTVIGLK